jgi:ADP-heptose:LPS heptosyltransferase
MGFKSLPNLRTAVWLSEADIATREKVLRTVEGAPFVVIVPGSQMDLRRWPAIAFIQMVQEFVRRTRLRPVLCGDESERGLCEEIQRSLRRRGIESDVLAGKTNLRELASVTSRAQICIGNETGTLHIAAAVGVPVVCLLGGGHYGRFFPYPGTERVSVVTNVLPCFGCDWICQFQEVLCLTGIQVQAVVDKAVTLYESQSEISRK